MKPPIAKKHIDRALVLEQAEVCLCDDENEEDTDEPKYLYSEVMEAVYGKEVWEYIEYIRNRKYDE